MQVLLTGGAGFIGSHLADILIQDGHEVTVLDNFCTSDKENIAHLQDTDGFRLIEQDVLDPLDLDQQFDYVLHLASRASPSDYQEHPVHTLRTNSEGTLRLLKLAREHEAKFLYASTSEVYGDPEEHPQREAYWGNVNPIGPRSMYDEAKRYGEAVTTSYAAKHGLDCRIIRIFNTYGPRMQPDDGRVVTNFVNQALNNEPITVYGDGTQTRSFCYVSDLVRGIRAAMYSETGEVFNLGNPDEYEIIELARIVQDLVETDSEIVHKELPQDDPERRRPDIQKAQGRLQWTPRVEFKEGLKKTIAHFKAR